MLKLNIPYSELRKRAQKLIGNKGVVTGVAATMGGKVYLVSFVGPTRYSFQHQDQGEKFTVWEIIDAQDFYGDPKRPLFVGQVIALEAELEALGLIEMPETLRELKIAYRKAAKQHHPDTGGNIEMFRFVEGAYRRLLLHFEDLQLA